jgi:hypothetical protein
LILAICITGNVTVHGFRDWARDETSYPRDLIETALPHVIGNKAEQAYRRSDALEKRRELMMLGQRTASRGREGTSFHLWRATELVANVVSGAAWATARTW